MSEDFDVEAYLDAQIAASKEKKETNSVPVVVTKEDNDVSNKKQDRRDRSRSRGHHNRSDRDRDHHRNRDRDRRDHSRERRDSHRRNEGREYDRRRRSPSPDRNRRRRSPSPDRNRKDRDRDRSSDRTNNNSSNRDRNSRPVVSEREKSPEVNKEEQRKKREIDDLTKDQRTIFVGQLTKKTTEKNLEDFFNQLGKVKNIIMLRDKITNIHKGFAYVEMADLDTIPDCLLFNEVVPNFQKFPILVKASEAEKNFLAKKDPFSNTYQQEPGKNSAPGTDANGEDARLYVGNIHISVDENALRTVLEQFGPTDTVKLHRDHLGNSKGFAFIKFVRADSARLAMSTLAGQELVGRPLKVGPVIDHGAAGSAVPFSDTTGGSMGGSESYVGNPAYANWKLDSDEAGAGLILNSTSRAMLMAKLGQAAGIEVPQPPQISSVQNIPVVPTMPSVQNSVPLIPPIGGIPSVNLLVCNMFDPTTETEPEWDLDIKEDMLEECSKHGQVEHVHIEKHKPGGIVLLKFTTIDAAQKTAKSLNGRFFAGRMITVTFIDDTMFQQLLL